MPSGGGRCNGSPRTLKQCYLTATLAVNIKFASATSCPGFLPFNLVLQQPDGPDDPGRWQDDLPHAPRHIFMPAPDISCPPSGTLGRGIGDPPPG